MHPMCSSLKALLDGSTDPPSHLCSILSPLLFTLSSPLPPSPPPASSPPPGIISVYFETNVSDATPQGFNASFWVRRCPRGSERGMEDGAPVCQARAQCQGGLCQCPQGYGGALCDRPLCPQDCGETEGRGSCNLVRGGVVISVYNNV